MTLWLFYRHSRIRATALGLLVALAVIAVLSCSCHSPADSKSDDVSDASPVTVAIQPFTGVTAAEIEAVRNSITQLYGVEVVVLPERDLPERAYYEPRDRYRAHGTARGA